MGVDFFIVSMQADVQCRLQFTHLQVNGHHKVKINIKSINIEN